MTRVPAPRSARHSTVLGGVELGGTNVVCALSTEAGTIEEVVEFPTVDPDATLARITDFFKATGAGRLEGLGVASFGPLDFRTGRIAATPKLDWRGCPIVDRLADALEVPVRLETDVNAAAIAEGRLGVAKGCATHAYVTVGTGIGVGAVIEGRPLRGLVHPEVGHQRIPRHERDGFAGSCPSHGDCWEGLASGAAIAARWGAPGEALLGRPEVWALECHYLAVGLANVVLALSPERLVLGGGVMAAFTDWGDLRRGLLEVLNGYLAVRELGDGIGEYLVQPRLGDRAGVLGALLLADAAAS